MRKMRRLNNLAEIIKMPCAKQRTGVPPAPAIPDTEHTLPAEGEPKVHRGLAESRQSGGCTPCHLPSAFPCSAGAAGTEGSPSCAVLQQQRVAIRGLKCKNWGRGMNINEREID